MSTGADAKTMPQTAEFDEGYERIFGKDRKPVRGRWIQDPQTGKLVPAAEYVPPSTDAQHAPILLDRFMEGAQATDGTDIGSRTKRREYMKQEGVTDSSDYGPGWADRVKAAREEKLRKATRETVARSFWTDPRWKP